MSGEFDEALLQAILRTSFGAFVEKVFATVSPGDVFEPNWHIEAVAHALTQCWSGSTRRLAITQPPRSLKSITASIAFPAWVLGKDPKRRVICVSYSQELSLELARQFRLVMGTEWYRRLFPRTILERDADNESITTAGGSRFATSIGGTLTGRGADIIIVDDPMKAEDAASEIHRRRAVEWYRGTLSTRLNDKRKGAIIIVMQRLHEEDLVGHVLASGEWRHLNLPAIATMPEDIEVGDGRFHHRHAGDVLHPKRESREALDAIRRELGTLSFSSQYGQAPVPAEGNLVRRDWLKFFDGSPTGPGLEIVQSWDVASAIGASADYSCCVTVAVHGGRYFVVDVWRGRLAYPDLKRQVIAEIRRFRPNRVLIEDVGVGTALVQDLRREAGVGPRPIAIRPDADKVTRMTAATAAIERGDLILQREATWLADFMSELLAFPNGRHDDQVDALSQLLRWHATRLRFPTASVFGPKIIY